MKSMNADEFAEKLRSLAPSPSALQRLGFNAEAVQRFRESYFCSRLSRSSAPNSVLELCSDFEVSRITIGAVRFQQVSAFGENHYQIAKFEADPIIVGDPSA